jgi:predicted ribosomally synthesized peptide with SipW-like signal peptide
MKKKTILVAAIAVMLVAALVVGGTLAYFTDTKTETNTFTMGNVKIALNEQQKGEKGLEPFVKDKQLVPGTSSDGNAVSKIVTVTNTSEHNDAWVWVELKIPAYLVSADYKTDPHQNESRNALHWNSYGCFNVEYNAGNYWKLATSDGIVGEDHKVTNPNMVAVDNGLWNDYKYVKTVNEGGTDYVVIRTTMENKLPAGKTSLPCLAQVYMDWRVTTSADGSTYNLPDGSSISTKLPWNVIVTAYAIQADGFNTVDEAVAAYSNNGK